MNEEAGDVLRVEIADGLATLIMNRPNSYNALDEALRAALRAALSRAARDSAIRCVVLTGAGTAFCSGQELKELPADSHALAESLRRSYNPIVMLLRTMAKPVVAAINGVAAGAGFSLALACDMRIMADTARLSCAFSSIGLLPDSGATFLLPRFVGVGQALELAFSGRMLGAEEALRLGIANRVIPRAELPAATRELGLALAARPTVALGLTKRAMNRALAVDLEDALEYEAALQQLAARTHDFDEGVRAFREKRTPRFEGR